MGTASGETVRLNGGSGGSLDNLAVNARSANRNNNLDCRPDSVSFLARSWRPLATS